MYYDDNVKHFNYGQLNNMAPSNRNDGVCCVMMAPLRRVIMVFMVELQKTTIMRGYWDNGDRMN